MSFAFLGVHERMNARKVQFKVSVTPSVVTCFERNLGCSSFVNILKKRNPFLNE